MAWLHNNKNVGFKISRELIATLLPVGVCVCV